MKKAESSAISRPRCDLKAVLYYEHSLFEEGQSSLTAQSTADTSHISRHGTLQYEEKQRSESSRGKGLNSGKVHKIPRQRKSCSPDVA